jgi:excisionase family DNA binding protein
MVNESLPPEIPKLMTANEVARLLRVSGRTVFALVERAELPAVRMGRCVRFDPADVLQYIGRAKRKGVPHGTK